MRTRCLLKFHTPNYGKKRGFKKKKKKLGNKNEITEILFLKEDVKKRPIFAIKV